MTRNFTATFLIVVSLVCCNTANEKKSSAKNSAVPDYTKLEQAGWLLGSWQNLSEHGAATENWEKENDSTFKAESFVIAEDDTVFYENVTLQLRKDTLDYVVRTKNQNEMPVSFRLVYSNEKTLVFENLQHDFPTKIVYNKVGADSLYAEVSGIINGTERKEAFPFKKTTP
ncbi:DUF6265 family protein [Niabella aquatica]